MNGKEVYSFRKVISFNENILIPVGDHCKIITTRLLRRVFMFFARLFVLLALVTAPVFCQTGLQFNGTNQYVSFGAATGTLGSSAYTLEAWVYKTAAGVTTTSGTGGVTAVPIIAKGRGEGETPANLNCNYFLGITASGNLTADFEDKATGLNHPITGVSILANNTWYHIAATYDGTTWRLYVNGVQDAFLVVGAFLPENTSIQHAALGTAMNSTGVAAGFFAGIIDEARIWNIARTPAEILASMNAEVISGTGLLGRWGLNDGTGTTAVNSIGGSPAGTLINGPAWVTGKFTNSNTALILQDGVNGYSGTRDTYTYDVSPANIRGTETIMVQDKNPATVPPDERKSLLQFDLSPIPAGATIQSAMLQFYVDAEGQGFNMHRMLVPWNEATTSYASIGNRHFAANNTDAETSVNANWPGVDTYTGVITVPVPASTIQDWINGTFINNGWLMIATHADDGQQLRSREHATPGDRPKLTISYSTGGVTNLAPNQPTNPSPSNNATSQSTSPNICTTVSDPEGSNLTIRYFGRKRPSSTTKFTIIGLPDTQFYTEELQGTNSSGGGHNGIFKAQTQWIANHRVDSSIAFVVQLGDCVQNGDNPPGTDKEIEWKRADTSMKIIENPNIPITYGIPYSICVGNHDQAGIGFPDATNVNYNKYFGYSRFNGRSYYGGHYGTDNQNNDDHYELFSGGGIDFIHISIEYYPNGTTASLQPVLNWADGLLKAYPNRKGIISSHNILGTGNPGAFQGPGQKIYDDLKDNPNLILMLAGHVAGEGRRTDVYNGNTIHTVMADYQSGYTNGGNGYLRIMQFLPDQNLIQFKTYSPYQNTSFTGAGSQFSLPVNLTDSYKLLGTNSGVASGSQTCKSWPSLDAGATYEWYAEISDGVNTINGPVMTFTTPSTPIVEPITGSTTVCTGATTQLADATAGGAWSSVDAGIAMVGANGLVTGVTAGSTTIHYAVTNSFGTTTVDANVTVTAGTTSGSVTTSICAGQTYTWPANGQTYSTAQTGLTYTIGCNTATLNLTVTPGTINTTTASACGSYTWANNGQTYTASGIYTGTITNCVTEKLNLTITAGLNNTTTAIACGSYTWALNGITYTSSGTYTMVNGCQTETLVLTINATPTAPVVTVVNNCGSSILSIPSGGNILWSNGNTSTSINVTSAGTYTVTRNVDGCTSAMGSGVAAPNQAPVMTASNITGSTTLNGCTAMVSFGSNINVTVTGKPTPVLEYKIGTTVITSPAVFARGSTIVTVTATNSCGSVSKNFQVSVSDKQYPIITCKPNATRSTASSTYIVSGTEFDASAADNCGTPAKIYKLSGVTTVNYNNRNTSLSGVGFNIGSTTITWRATDASGNISTCKTVVTVSGSGKSPVVASKSLPVDPNPARFTVKVLPNPTSKYFMLALKSISNEEFKIMVVDETGRLIEQKEGIAANSTLQIGHKYPTGIYITEVLQGTERVILRLIKVQ